MPKYFALLCVILLTLFGIVIYKEINPEWKFYQKEYYKLLAEKTGKEEYKDLPTKINQIWLPKLNRADRCTTCHLGIENPMFKEAKNPYKAHPDFPGLKKHPFSKFGCTVCHEGQGRATTKLAAHGAVKYWLYPKLEGNYIQSSCFKCHQKEEKLAGAPLLNKGRKLFFYTYSCSACHEIKGLKGKEYIGPDLNHLKTKLLDHNWLVRFAKNPHDYREKSPMPACKVSLEEAKSITSYLYSVSKPVKLNSPTSDRDLEWGEELIYEAGCDECHGFEEGEKGLDLTRIGEKIGLKYLFNWIKRPKFYQPGTRMKDLKLADDEATSIAYYLTTLKEERESREVMSIEELNNKELIAKGRKLLFSKGCSACHNIPGVEKPKAKAAELTKIGEKLLDKFDFGELKSKIKKEVGLDDLHKNVTKAKIAWFKQKLKNSRSFSKELKMPNYNLSEEEIEALTIFLIGLK
jgi:mono/diheme cytochrome c family protein